MKEVNTLLEAARSVLNEVTPGVRPLDTDSYLPPGIRDRLAAAVEALTSGLSKSPAVAGKRFSRPAVRAAIGPEGLVVFKEAGSLEFINGGTEFRKLHVLHPQGAAVPDAGNPAAFYGAGGKEGDSFRVAVPALNCGEKFEGRVPGAVPPVAGDPVEGVHDVAEADHFMLMEGGFTFGGPLAGCILCLPGNVERFTVACHREDWAMVHLTWRGRAMAPAGFVLFFFGGFCAPAFDVPVSTPTPKEYDE